MKGDAAQPSEQETSKEIMKMRKKIKSDFFSSCVGSSFSKSPENFRVSAETLMEFFFNFISSQTF